MKNINLLKQTANNFLEQNCIENNMIEYKKSFEIIQWQTILKTVCAFSNNLGNNDYNFIFIGVEEENNKEPGDKATPIIGVSESKVETTISQLKVLIKGGNLSIRPNVEFLDNVYNDKHYILIVVFEGNELCKVTDKGTKYIKNKLEEQGIKENVKIEPVAYVRVERDSIKATYT